MSLVDQPVQAAYACMKRARTADVAGGEREAMRLYARCRATAENVVKHMDPARNAANAPVVQSMEKLIRQCDEQAARISEALEAQAAQAAQAAAVAAETTAAPTAPTPTARLLTESTGVGWGDVAGLHAAKQALEEAVLLPLWHPELYVGPVTPWRGVLLYGPPGTGKTHIARALATEARTAFMSVSAKDMVSKWQGESEKNITALFADARASAPCIVFMDEVDAIAGEGTSGNTDDFRVRIQKQLLIEMDGLGTQSERAAHVMVLGATNEPWSLSAAFRRRFEQRVYIPLPDADACGEMVATELRGSIALVLGHEEARGVARRCRAKGYSGHDVAMMVRSAVLRPVREICAARFFRPVSGAGGGGGTDADADAGLFEACTRDPPCARCPMLLFADHGGDVMRLPLSRRVCARCGAVRASMRAIKLRARTATLADFDAAIAATPATVDPASIARFEEWTRQFGVA